jgi:hypothetical protein
MEKIGEGAQDPDARWARRHEIEQAGEQRCLLIEVIADGCFARRLPLLHVHEMPIGLLQPVARAAERQ